MNAAIGKAEAFGLDGEGGKWVAVCDQHGTSLNASTKKFLLNMETSEFCECCAGFCECKKCVGA